MKGILKGIYLGSFTSKKGNVLSRVLDVESGQVLILRGDLKDVKVGDRVILEVGFNARFGELINIVGVNKF
ncbi:MAG: hypothetical protein ACPLXO_03810 [Desulfurella sp.]|jgi:cell shape-determining protein MreC